MTVATKGYYEFEPKEITSDWLSPVMGHRLYISLTRQQALDLKEVLTRQLANEDDDFLEVEWDGEMKFDQPEAIEIEGSAVVV